VIGSYPSVNALEVGDSAAAGTDLVFGDDFGVRVDGAAVEDPVADGSTEGDEGEGRRVRRSCVCFPGVLSQEEVARLIDAGGAYPGQRFDSVSGCALNKSARVASWRVRFEAGTQPLDLTYVRGRYFRPPT
jgi:hypothetical protein